MKNIEGTSRQQLWVEALCIDELVEKDNEVRVIDLFVEQSDFEEMGFNHAQPRRTGRPSYRDKDLAKMYVYGYLNRIRSSRRLEKESHRNVEMMWLMRGLKPDDRTICSFRSNNSEALKNMFRGFNRFFQQVELMGNETAAIDGTKLRANNGRKNYFTKKEAEERQAKLEQRIEEYMKLLDANDTIEAGETKSAKERKAIRKLMGNHNKMVELLARMKETGEEKGCTVDHEARLMKQSKGSYDVCYNVQTVTDEKYGIITAYEVTNACNDNEQLEHMAKQANDAAGVGGINILADGGYVNGEAIHRLEKQGIVCYVPKNEPGHQPNDERFHRERFVYDEATDSVTCPAGQVLPYKRICKTNKRKQYYNIKACKDCLMREFCTKAGYRKYDRGMYEANIVCAATRAINNPELYSRRKELAEHPFGVIKHVWGYGHFLCRGKGKASGEVALALMAFNLRRAINIKGVKNLMKMI
jgi:transposase